MSKTIFSEADILLPSLCCDHPDFTKWAVIACDQFTSEPSYWQEVENISRDALSTLSLILPEVYLETDKEEAQKQLINSAMEAFPSQLCTHRNTIVFIERTLSDGSIRRGIVGKIDIAAYEYEPSATAQVCATEETVISRLPPRVEIRRNAKVELPHVMVFYDDIQNSIMNYLESIKADCPVIYDFPLMLGGGHLKGYQVCGERLKGLLALIGKYELSKERGAYAVGDGNHSLAAAKVYYNQLREAIGEAAEAHPARYALCELVNIHESSVVFEPIYRLLKNVDVQDFLRSLPAAGREVQAHFQGQCKTIYFPNVHPLDIGCMQDFIDRYIEAHPGVICDYIHGEDSLLKLSQAECSIAFLCNGIEKAELLPYIAANGPLPRKTFSMGGATTKRYYNEARAITEI